jgi:hypothetical protein
MHVEIATAVRENGGESGEFLMTVGCHHSADDEERAERTVRVSVCSRYRVYGGAPATV